MPHSTRQNFIHHKSLHHFKINQHNSLYITNTLKHFSEGLVTIFLPLYIYTNAANYTTLHVNTIINGILWCLLFFLVHALASIFCILAFTKTIFNYMHPQRAILLSVIIQIIQSAILISANTNETLLILTAILAGLKTVFYWLPYHVLFVDKFKHVGGEHYGDNISVAYFLLDLVSAIAPLLGGAIITLIGFKALFILAIVILTASALPILFKVHQNAHITHDDTTIFKHFIFKQKHLLSTISYTASGFENLIYLIFWPLLMYYVMGDFSQVGLLNFISLTIAAFTTLDLGKMMDKYGTKKFHISGSIATTLLYAPRLIAQTTGALYLIDIVDRILSPLFVLPELSYTYEKAKTHNAIDYIVYRELVWQFGIVLSCIASALFVITINWQYIFVMAMVAALTTCLMQFDKS